MRLKNLLPALLFVIASLNLFADNGCDILNPDITIQLEEDRGRFAFSADASEQSVNIYGLKAGEDYKIMMVQELPCTPTIRMLQNNNAEKVITFTADKDCADFFVYSDSKSADCNGIAYISINCTSCKKESKFEKMANLQVSGGQSAQSLIEDVFIGGNCFEVTGVTTIGNGGGRGSFTQGTSSLGIESGVILESGSINNAPGPNNSNSAGTGFGGGGDPDLALLTSGAINDAVGIEFDFTPTIDVINFNYVFASEEYCEWVGSVFNDVFGFFISGPGISGGFTLSGENIAVLPGSGIAVAINNVNHLSNTGYFVPNQGNCGGFTNAAEIEFDGYTVSLTATATVIPCSTYHIRLIVGDVGDDIYDSAVFLEENSFDAGGAFDGSAFSATTGTNIVYEPCADGIFTFQRIGGDLSLPDTVFFTLSPNSTATEGVDFGTLPPFVIVPPGATSVDLPINVISDLIIEGQETIILELSNACQCSSTEVELIIDDPEPLDVSLSDQDLCAGSPAAGLTPGISGGLPPNFTYLWSDGSTGSTNNVSPLTTTTYIVTVTDNCGQSDTASATINITTPPTAAISGNGNLCAGSAGTIDLPINFTGDAPWTFVYTIDGVPQPPITTSTNPYIIVANEIGIYQLASVESSGGSVTCDGSVSGVASIIETNITLSTNDTEPLCNGSANGEITVSVSGGTPLFDYAWSNGGPNFPTLFNVNPGIYTVTVTDGNGCTEEITTTISEPPELTANANAPTQATCGNPVGGSASVTVNGGTPGYSYLWDPPTSGGANPSGLAVGTYNVTITDANMCTAETSVTITEDTTPPVAVANSLGTLDCINTQITVSGNGSSLGAGFTYQWTGPGIMNGGNSLNPQVNQIGTYTLLVTNTANGCTEETSVTVTGDQTPPIAIANGGQVTCTNNIIFINGVGSSVGGNYSYNWSGPSVIAGGTTLSPQISGPGNYTITVTNSNNGCTSTATAVVVDNTAPPFVNITGSSLSCSILSTTLNGSGSSVGPNFNYNWTGPGIAGSSTILSPTITQPGTYELTITNTNNGCTAAAELTINQDTNAPTASAGPDVTLDCINSSSSLNGFGSSSGSNFSYNWTGPPGSFIGGNGTLSPVVTTPGTYTLTVTNTLNGCTESAEVVVSEDTDPPIVTVGTPGILNCYTPTMTLDGTGSSTGNNFSYIWTTTGNITSGQTTLNPTLDEPGIYTLVVYNNENGCSDDATVVVDDNMILPIANVGPNQMITCTQTLINLTGAGSSAGSNISYLWTSATGNILTDPTTLDPVVNEPGLYELLVTDIANGCTAVASMIVDVDSEVPIADAGPNQEITCITSSLLLDGTNSSSGGNFSFSWETLDGNITSGINTLTPTVDASGTYELIISNSANGCTAVSTAIVTVNQEDPVAEIEPAELINCTNLDIVIDASNSSNIGNFTYSWTTLDGSLAGGITSLTPQVNAAGTYTLNIIDNDNGCETNASIIVDDNFDTPTAIIANPALLTCAVNEVTIDANASTNGNDLIYQWSTPNGSIVSGMTGLSPNVNAIGNYTLLITNTLSNCVDSASIEVTEDILDPTIDPGSSGLIDCENPTFTLNGSANGGSNLDVLWTTNDGSITAGNTTLTPEVDAGGTYTLLVTNTDNGCTTSESIFIDEDANIPEADIAVNELLNCSTNALVLDGTNSTTGVNIIYNWESLDGNFVDVPNSLAPSIDAPGTYSLTIIDTTNNCENSTSIIIPIDTIAPIAIANTPGMLTCDILEIDLDGTASSSTGDLSINWTTNNGTIVSGNNSYTPTISTPGIYTINVTNNENGCSANAITEVLQDIVDPIVSIEVPDELTCATNSTIIDGTASSNGGNYEYLWTSSDGNIVNGNNTLQPLVNMPGTYDLLITNTENGCTSNAAELVVENIMPPQAEAGPTAILTCDFTNYNLDGSASSTGALYNYLWSSNDGNIVNGSNTISPEINAPGTYNLLVTNITNACVDTASVTISQNIITPDANAGLPAELSCTISEVILDGSLSTDDPDIQYTWTTQGGNITSGANSTTPIVNAPGIYIIEVMNTVNGCFTTAEVEVTQDANLPNADAGTADDLTCNINELTLDGSNSDNGVNFSYLWTTIDGNITSDPTMLMPTINEPGTYTLEVTNSINNCTTISGVTVILDDVAPNADAGQTEELSCAVQDLSLNAGNSSQGNEFVYQWNSLDGNITNGDQSLTPQIDAPGTYEILITNTINGCTASDAVEITQSLEVPDAFAANPAELTCTIEQIIIDATASSQGNEFTYNWTTTNGNIVNGGNSLEPIVNEPGEYQLVVVNQNNGCSNTLTIPVDENVNNPDAEANFADDLTCIVSSVILDGEGSSQGNNYSYLWSTTDGNIMIGNQSLNPTVNEPGNYSILVTDLINGCTSTDIVNVDLNDTPPNALIANPGELTCIESTVFLDATDSDTGNNFEYQWFTTSGNIVNGATTLSPEVNAIGIYNLVVTNNINGCTEDAQITVTQDIEPPIAEAGNTFVKSCVEDIEFLAGNGSANGAPVSYLWDTGNGNIVAAINTASPGINAAGVYNLVVTNLVNGCTDSDAVTITEDAPLADRLVNQPLCFGDNGALAITNVVGGATPYLYSIDGGENYYTQTAFDNLTPGIYNTVVIDDKGCTHEESVEVDQPEEVNVAIEPEIHLDFGDSYQIQTLVSIPESEIGQISWTPTNGTLSCEDCLDPIATPLTTTLYKVTVVDKNGCEDTAPILFRVNKQGGIYVPNAFSPNGDGTNDVIMIFAKEGTVRKINSFLVFSRWGETVYQYYNFEPNNPAYGWDGAFREDLMNPAVFAWFAEVEFIDGEVRHFEGDVTLVR